METMNYVFDASQVAPDAGLDAVPAGTYDVQVDTTEIVENKGGKAFKVGFVIIAGDYVGRKVFNNYNIWHNTSADAVRIAQGQLSALCHVVGVFKLDFNNAGVALKGARLKLDVTNDGKYNSVRSVMDVNGNKPGSVGRGPAPAAPAAVATPGQQFAQPQVVAPAAAPAWPQPGQAPAPVAPAPQQYAAPPVAYPQQPAPQPVATAPAATIPATPAWPTQPQPPAAPAAVGSTPPWQPAPAAA